METLKLSCGLARFVDQIICFIDQLSRRSVLYTLCNPQKVSLMLENIRFDPQADNCYTLVMEQSYLFITQRV